MDIEEDPKEDHPVTPLVKLDPNETDVKNSRRLQNKTSISSKVEELPFSNPLNKKLFLEHAESLRVNKENEYVLYKRQHSFKKEQRN